MTEWQELAHAIICQALHDIKMFSPNEQEHKTAKAFLKSKYFEELALSCDMSPEMIRRKVADYEGIK